MRPYNDYCLPYVAPFNATGHPAVVMPLGTSKGDFLSVSNSSVRIGRNLSSCI